MSLYDYLPALSENTYESIVQRSSNLPMMGDAFSGETLISCLPRDNSYKENYSVEYVLSREPSALDIVGISLDLLPVDSSGEILDIELTEKILRSPSSRGIAGADSLWDEKIRPILEFGPNIKRIDPNMGIRIYLGKNLEFLSDLLAEFYEVWQMRTSTRFPSLRANLGLEDHSQTYTLINASDVSSVLERVTLSRAIKHDGLGMWRLPRLPDVEGNCISYRPIAEDSWGVSCTYPVQDLLSSFHNALNTGDINITGIDPSNGKSRNMACLPWSDRQLNEFFLCACLYPRLAQFGVLTVVPPFSTSNLLLADIEFATWLNPSSTCSFNTFNFLSTGGMVNIARDRIREQFLANITTTFYRNQVPPV